MFIAHETRDRKSCNPAAKVFPSVLSLYAPSPSAKDRIEDSACSFARVEALETKLENEENVINEVADIFFLCLSHVLHGPPSEVSVQ